MSVLPRLAPLAGGLRLPTLRWDASLAASGRPLVLVVVITANAGEAAWTPDEGTTWFSLPGVTGYWAVAFASPQAGWLVGTNGRILKISF